MCRGRHTYVVANFATQGKVNATETNFTNSNCTCLKTMKQTNSTWKEQTQDIHLYAKSNPLFICQIDFYSNCNLLNLSERQRECFNPPTEPKLELQVDSHVPVHDNYLTVWYQCYKTFFCRKYWRSYWSRIGKKRINSNWISISVDTSTYCRNLLWKFYSIYPNAVM